MSFQKSVHGFTLLEMIVAIAVFAVIAMISFANLNRFINDQASLDERLLHLKQLQLAFSILGRDMHFLVQRPVRNAYGDLEPALVFDADVPASRELIRFTTARADDRYPDRASLQRTAYRLEQGRLYRYSWQVLDRDQDSREDRRLLLSGLKDVQVVPLLPLTGEQQDEPSLQGLGQLPDGFEWRFIMEDGREYRRVYEVRHAR